MEQGGRSREDGSCAGGEEEGASGSGSSWSPCGRAFRPYTPAQTSTGSLKSSTLRVVVRRPLLARLTKDLVETFQICNPNFKYSEVHNTKRPLTCPSEAEKNYGYDNKHSDLILYVDSVLVNMGSKQRYFVKDILGQGTFGQVAKCWLPETNSYVAVKIIKNLPAYYQQALVEVSILTKLNQKFGPEEKRHIVRILDYFVYHGHLCISFEMLGSNLYELIKMNQFRGFPLSIVQVFSKQILHALVVIKDAGIIHCDLKPENILLSTNKTPEIKIIDFGSACLEGRTVYSYIQSRYYRSPEVLLGFPYTTAIDMWSFGCIVAELFLGLPLFSGASEFDLLKRMVEILGGQPPDDMLRVAKNTSKFFKHVGSIYRLGDDETCRGSTSAYRVLTEAEYESRESEKPNIGKRYFNYVKLEDIIANYPYKKNLPQAELSRENLTRLALVDFLRGLVEFDPGKRWSPMQASRHPFVTGEPFTRPYEPPPETPRIPVMHTITVDHNPGGGHWVAAGLSPQVSNVNKCLSHNNPHFQMIPMSLGSSYGSLGSHGSYNDNAGLGSSYGSYGDINNMYSYFSPVGPCGLNIQTQVGGSFLGASPDARCRPQMSHGNGFGVSPTGSLGPMSLGASPSQFTPPSSQMQMSTVSPGKYGPTSPARGSVHGSPLGKAAAVCQFNRRRSWGYPGTSSMQPHENASQHWQGHHGDVTSPGYPDSYAQGHVGSPHSTLSASNHSNWRQQMGGGNGLLTGPSSNHMTFASNSFIPNAVSLHPSEISTDKHECSSSLPDPADWDPNYSDELLLQEDNSEVTSLTFGIANSVCLDNTMNSGVISRGAGKSGHRFNQAHTNTNLFQSNQRTEGQFQAYSHAESSPHPVQDIQAGYGRFPPFSQNSPSRFGQQSAHRYNQQSTFMRGERTHQMGQPSHSNYSMTDSHSSANTIFSGSMSWGRRVGYPISTTLPASHARKDYGRIS